MSNHLNLLESWTAEVAARAGRVRALIGSAHWASDGQHKESLIRGFLDARLPRSAAVCHGFLTDPHTGARSREIDVFIRDANHSAPLLEESGLTISHPDSLLGVIEVKSAFRSDSLAAAMELVESVGSVLKQSRAKCRPWKGVMFMGPVDGAPPGSVCDTLVAAISRSSAQYPDTGGKLQHLPTCVASLEGFCAFIGHEPMSDKIRVRYFNSPRMAFALAMSDLLTHSYSHFSRNAEQVVEQVVVDGIDVEPVVRTI